MRAARRGGEVRGAMRAAALAATHHATEMAVKDAGERAGVEERGAGGSSGDDLRIA